MHWHTLIYDVFYMEITDNNNKYDYVAIKIMEYMNTQWPFRKIDV